MKLILLPRNGGQSFTLDTARGRDIGLIFAMTLLPFVLGSLCLWFFLASSQQADGRQILADWQLELSRQSATVEQAHTQVGDELSAITIKVAELQARVMRLDALGQQVAQIARLDNGEFDFTRQPAMGGPELAGPDFASDGAEASIQPIQQQLSLQQMLDSLVVLIDNREQQLALLDKQLTARETRIQAFVAGRPIAKGWMSSAFGKRTDPFSGKQSWHEGVDFAGKSGSDVIAVAGGVVSYSAKRSGYGQVLEISHGDGFVTRYAHNESHSVEVGDVVAKGQVIASMGSSGRSTGPHVHFEVLRHGKPMNPARYIHRASL